MKLQKSTLILALGLAAALGWGAAAGAAPAPAATIEKVTLPSASSPLVAVRLMFAAGSIHDPAGKEGLASLTALMVGQGATAKRSYSDLLEALYPMAASIDVKSDREVTVFSGQVHRDKLGEYTALLQEALLHPAFAETDLARNRDQLLAYLTTSLRAGSDELLGLEVLQDEIFQGHPYGHAPEGTVEGLKSITLADVKKFYQEHYTPSNLLLGFAGGYPADYPAQFEKALAALPSGAAGASWAAKKPLPAPAEVKGRHFTLIEKTTGSVGVHFGFPLPINRSQPEYYPLMVLNSYMGEHRTSHGQLMQKLRRDRGLNYGDYSYIEYWWNPPSTSSPEPGTPRRQQYFSVWLRPVVPTTAHFALRAALFELDRVRRDGLTQEDFELARDFLLNYSKLWAQNLSNRLGYTMDSKFYGMPYYIDEIDARLKKVTLAEVNAAAKKYLSTENYRAVLVTDKAADLKAALEKDEPSPMVYNSPPPEEILAEDKSVIGLKVKPTEIRIVPVDQVFQK